MNCIVVIPIYKNVEALSNNETKSIRQCFKILGAYDICFVGPPQINFEEYLKMGNKQVNITYKNFAPEYFESIAGYNNLLLLPDFYYAFKNYLYLLLYQTDAYVFRDELQNWCAKEYDYIGAPWFEGYQNPSPSSKIIGVGNGGLSLRNVKTSIRVLRRLKQLKKIRNFWIKSHLNNSVKFYTLQKYFFQNFFKIKNIEYTNDLFLYSGINEDYYWTQLIGNFFKDYTVSSVEDAIRFSFEARPALLYKENNNQLPFGCHAWQKYEPEFWAPFISTEDLKIVKA